MSERRVEPPSGPRRPARLGRILLVAAIALAPAAALPQVSTASARDLTDAERSDLPRTIERFQAAMRSGDVPGIVAIIPPRVVARIAADAGLDEAKVREAMIQQTRQVLASGVLRGFRMDLANARHGATPDGTPYALVPTTTTVRIGDRDSEQSSNSLAMMDGGRWYLLDLNQPSRVAIFTRVYPEFQGVPLGGRGI